MCAVSSLRSRAGAVADGDCSEGDYSPSKELQDELLLRQYPPVLGLQGM